MQQTFGRGLRRIGEVECSGVVRADVILSDRASRNGEARESKDLRLLYAEGAGAFRPLKLTEDYVGL